MYKSFYSLAKDPFIKNLKTEDGFTSNTFKEGRARLDYLKQTKGMGLLVGEPGAGKTFLLRSFQASLNPSLYKVIYFPMSSGTVMDFYRGLALGLGEVPMSRKVDLFCQIQHSVMSFSKERRITPVFILDEMQLAKNAFLHDLCLLFNFNMDSENPFILVLAGLPFLMDKLTLNQYQPLSQRMVMRYKLEPLTKDEVAEYVTHQLELAGSKHPIFSESALEAIASRTRGWPRLINGLATNCLLLGFQKKQELINEEIVRIAALDMGI